MNLIRWNPGRLGSGVRLTRIPVWTLVCVVSVVTVGVGWGSQPPSDPPGQPALQSEPNRSAGPVEGGYLLPNGWTITPAGRQVTIGDLPLNILPLADGRYALAGTCGFNTHELNVIDLEKGQVVERARVRQSWFGLAYRPADRVVWWAGGGSGLIHSYRFDPETAKLERINDPEPILNDLTRAAAPKLAAPADPNAARFRTGLVLSRDGRTLYALDINEGRLDALDADSGKLLRRAKVGVRPYDVVFSPNGAVLYVSDWSQRQVLVVDPADLRVIATIGVGEHPNQIVVDPKQERLFVANASSNTVSVIDARAGVVVETIVTSLFPNAPEGSTPDALAITPDGSTLFVANADNNCVAVVDVATPRRSAIKGFIPTGWYPTALAVTPDGGTLLVGVGKGNQSRANPPSEEYRKQVDEILKRETITDLPKETLAELKRFPYIGTLLSGAVSIVPIPDDAQLAAYTEQVYKNCPYTDRMLDTADAPTHPTAIPVKVGDPSPIEHVIYIIKENRTYDQVFGDLPQGNGDPTLTLFGREVTPNHHKLAEEFVLLDNLYCNGQVSADGHPWSTMAYNTDYLARNWMLTYSRRTGIDLDDEAMLAKAPSGFLWDACAHAGLSYRSYGEYGNRVSQPDGTVKMEARVPGLVGHICPDYGIPKVPGRRPRDTDNAEVFLAEFREFETNGNLPRLIIMSLGEDHTDGTRPGAFTPQACVASNDLALGRIVEAVSKSRYWPKTAIFVIEDDAQNGPDHVDAHRTVGLVVSPYAKRKVVDSTMYQTVSMIRTIGLILGLPPLSQYDAGATPMFKSFTNVPDLTPYDHEPARIDLNAVNTELAYGAKRSMEMDFSDYDKIDDFELNEILWRAIKGADAPMPPAVRRALAFRPRLIEGETGINPTSSNPTP